MGVLLPQEMYQMDAPPNARIHPSVKLICPASLFSLLSHHLQYTLYHNPLPDISNPHGTHSRVLIYNYQTDEHEHPVYGPWGPIFCQPLCELRKNLTGLIACLPKLKQPVIQDYQVGAPRPGSP